MLFVFSDFPDVKVQPFKPSFQGKVVLSMVSFDKTGKVLDE